MQKWCVHCTARRGLTAPLPIHSGNLRWTGSWCRAVPTAQVVGLEPPLSPVFPGLISFSPQGPRGRRDHRGLQAPQAPKATGARQARQAQQGLLVRTLARSFVSWGTGPGLLPYLSRRIISYTPQHPNCCPSPAL